MKTRVKLLFNLLVIFIVFVSLLGNSIFIQKANAASDMHIPTYKPLATPNTWDSAGTGLNGRVYRMIMVGKDLYAAGEFTNAGGIAEADYIAKWDGTAWSALGTIPLNNVVFTLATNGTDLYMAGTFTHAGDIVGADYLAKWDGTDWSAIGPVLNNSVSAIAISGTDVYVGGHFTNASGDANADHIAKLTGGVGAWSSLGSGTDDEVQSIVISGDDVYIGGSFTSAGGVANTSKIAKFSGGTWSALGTGMDDAVYVIAIKGTDVYAGGDFDSAGGVADTSGIAKFSGGSWSALGSGLPFSYVRDIALIDNEVFASGYFDDVDGDTSIQHLAKFSDGTWSALGGVTGADQVDAIAISPGGDSIYAGGIFTDWAGNVNADYIARFEPASTTITVNTNADELNADGDCSLREAIQSAELNSATDACIAGNASGPDIIVFHNSLGTANIMMNTDLPELSKTYGLTILGGRDITIDGNNTNRLFVINEKAYLKIDGLTITRGNAGSNYGGGLANNSGYAVITNSTFLFNSAYGSGAVDNISGDMVIANSTFSGNANTVDEGAAIYNYLGRTTIVNSTFSGNITSTNTISTIANIGILRMFNTIIANTINGRDCYFSQGIMTANNNLIESTGASACGLTNGVNGNIIGSDPDLGSLTGSPAFFPLNVGSPAINAGDDTICAAAPVNNTSQGGITRPIGAHCDIGSYEAGADINITIGGAIQGGYALGSGESDRASYAGLNSGPVKVQKTNSLPIIASERVAYTPDGGTTWTSFDEMMGLPSNQLTDTYYFPYYNNVEMNTQLRFGNVGTSNTTVTVTIGGVVQGNYFLIPNQSMRLSYNLNSGPVKVQSSGSVPIIASIRFANIESTSPLVVPAFTEMMGLPGNQLTTTYIFPHYNNVEMNTQLRFGNVGTSATNVTVTIGGVVQGVYPVAPSQSVRLFYNLNSGPVKVQSSGGVPIIASMRFANIESESPLVISYFSEMLGLPQASLSTNYWFPIYDNVTHNMQLRFGNMGTTSTTVTVRVGGVEQGSYVVLPNQSQRLFYTLNDGPVQVQSSGGIPIIASIRFAFIESESPLVIGAFSEMLGLPAQQLSSTYLFPWYNNEELDTQMRIAVP